MSEDPEVEKAATRLARIAPQFSKGVAKAYYLAFNRNFPDALDAMLLNRPLPQVDLPPPPRATAPPPRAPSPEVPATAPTATDSADPEVVANLQDMFPSLPPDVIRRQLIASGGDFDAVMVTLAELASAQDAPRPAAPTAASSQSPTASTSSTSSTKASQDPPQPARKPRAAASAAAATASASDDDSDEEIPEEDYAILNSSGYEAFIKEMGYDPLQDTGYDQSTDIVPALDETTVDVLSQPWYIEAQRQASEAREELLEQIEADRIYALKLQAEEERKHAELQGQCEQDARLAASLSGPDDALLKQQMEDARLAASIAEAEQNIIQRQQLQDARLAASLAEEDGPGPSPATGAATAVSKPQVPDRESEGHYALVPVKNRKGGDEKFEYVPAKLSENPKLAKFYSAESDETRKKQQHLDRLEQAKKDAPAWAGEAIFNSLRDAVEEDQAAKPTKKSNKKYPYNKKVAPVPKVEMERFTFRVSQLGNAVARVRGDFREVNQEVVKITNIIRANHENRFTQAWKKTPGDTPVLCYHGTSRKNLPSIATNGLMVPGEGGIRVVHGSAYGVGIYVALKPGTSMGYCGGSNQMLVCVALVGTGVVTADHGSFLVIKESARVIPLFIVQWGPPGAKPVV